MQYNATAVVDFRVAGSRSIRDRLQGRTNFLHVTFDKSFEIATAQWAGQNKQHWVLMEERRAARLETETMTPHAAVSTLTDAIAGRNVSVAVVDANLLATVNKSVTNSLLLLLFFFFQLFYRLFY